VHLQRPVDDLARHVRREHLDHRDLLLRRLVARAIHLPGSIEHHEARRVDHDARLRDALASDALVRDGSPKGNPFSGTAAHFLKRHLCLPDETHAMMDTARPEPSLRDLEAAPLAEQHVRNRHAHVLQLDLHVAVRRVVVAEDG